MNHFHYKKKYLVTILLQTRVNHYSMWLSPKIYHILQLVSKLALSHHNLGETLL